MKRIFLLLVILLSVCIQAQEVRSIKDLRPNDTFDMRISIPIGNAKLNSVWDFDKGYKIDVNFQVLSSNNNSIELAIKPKRLFVLAQNDTEKNTYAFYDSNYFSKDWFSLFESNSVTTKINIDNGEINTIYKEDIYNEKEKSTGRDRKEWYTQSINIPKGLRLFQSIGEPTTDFDLDFDKVIKLSLTALIKEWQKNSKTGLSMPWLISINSNKQEPNTPVFLQITNASFYLSANTIVTFSPPKEMPEDRIFITIGDERIKPVTRDGNTYTFKFFLSAPKRICINNLKLDITPTDSLIASYNSITKEYDFSGKGASNSAYTQKIAQLYDGKLPNITGNARDTEFLKNVKANFAKNEEFFNSTLATYINGMNEYWIKSARLSFDYWFINQRLELYEKASERFDTEQIPILKQYLKDNPDKFKEADREFNLNNLYEFSDEVQIPWINEHFTNIFPLADYLYQPYTYNSFTKDFFTYKANETSNTIINRMKYLHEHIPSYYFTDAIFWGYPKSYLTSETLKDIMVNFQLDVSNREYEDFLNKLHDPDIRKSVINLHEQLLKIEPGANIKDLKLEIENLIPLKNNPDKYILLLVGDEKIGYNPNLKSYETNIKEIYKSFEDALKEKDLTDKAEICIITSEAGRTSLNDVPEIQDKIHFVPDEKIRDYEDKVVSRERSFILLKSNGQIINRYHPSEYRSSIHFLIKLIQEDIQKQNNQNSASSGVLVIIITILISGSITFLLARYIVIRRERIKRRIQELELKAIRAQMNPHFTFNALGSIQNLISQKKDKEANDYLVNFAKLLRMVLSTSEKKLVTLSEEIELLDLYLHLEQLRIPFQYTLNISENIDIHNEEIPGMLIQPIVENAVKHGIIPKGGGNINLNFQLENHILRVDVIDSGEGFSQTVNEDESGFGLKSVRERLSLLNKERHLNINLSIENIMNNGVIKGAKVSIFIPV